jgi:hypothetical protein
VRRSASISSLALALVLLTAIALRALTPAGWMPTGQPGAPMVICTGEGPMALKAPGDHVPAPDSKAHHEPCAFSGLGFAPAPESRAVAVAERVLFALEAPAAPRSSITPGRGLAAPPPPARGPPIQLT